MQKNTTLVNSIRKIRTRKVIRKLIQIFVIFVYTFSNIVFYPIKSEAATTDTIVLSFGCNNPDKVTITYNYPKSLTLTKGGTLVPQSAYPQNLTGTVTTPNTYSASFDTVANIFKVPSGYVIAKIVNNYNYPKVQNTYYKGDTVVATWIEKYSTKYDSYSSLTAYCAKTYTITFNYNGATGGNTKTSVAIPNGYAYNFAGNLPAPTKTGYTFGGWYKENTFTNKVENSTTMSSTSNHTLYAKWTPITYSVKYNGNGATSGSMSNSSHTYATAKALTDNAFSRTGYTFKGWATSSTGSLAYSNKQSVSNLSSTSGDTVNLYAIWTPNTYTVTYNSNGGSGTMDSQTATYNANFMTRAFNYTKTGYSWNGYNEAANGSGTAWTKTGSGVASNWVWTYTNNITLYAQWEANTYTLKYDGNNANGGSVASETLTYDSAQKLKDNAFTKVFTYTYNANGGNCETDSDTVTSIFKNWNTKADGTGTTYDTVTAYKNFTSTQDATVTLYAIWDNKTITLPDATRYGYTLDGWYEAELEGKSGATVTPSASKTLNANWTPNEHSLNFEYNGATSGNELANTTIVFDASYGTLPTPERVGYSFDDWYADETFNTKVSQDTVLTDDSDKTIYANWIVNDYTVNFEYNEATGDNNELSKTVTFDAAYGALPTPTKTGYSFDGWYSDAEFTHKITSDSIVNIGTDHALYAKWNAKTYKVTYSYNGADLENSEIDKDVVFDSPYGTLPNPKKTGYTFNGWYLEDNFVNLIDENSTVSINNNHTLYAKFTANTYTVKFNKNGGKGSIDDETFVYDESKTLTLNEDKITRTGYIFEGWKINSTNAAATYTDGQSVINLASSGTFNLYAAWRPITYTVKLDANTGSGTMNSFVATYDTPVNLPANTFVKSNAVNFDFNGGTGKSNQTYSSSFKYWAIGDPSSTEKINDGGSLLNLCSVDNSEVTLYAKWDTNNISLPNAVKSGYLFGGWYKDPNLLTFVGMPDDSYKASTDNDSLYAYWIDLSINNITNKTFTKNAITCDDEIVLYDKTTKLIKDVDYTLTYSNNVNASNTSTNPKPAEVKIDGLGKYKGSKTNTFIIDKKKIKISDVLLPTNENGKNVTLFKDGVKQVTTHVGTDTLKPYYQYDGDEIFFSYQDATFVDSLKEPIYNGDFESSKTHKNILLTNIKMIANSPVTSNYTFCDDDGTPYSSGNTNEKLFTNSGYLVDNVSPYVVAVDIANNQSSFGKTSSVKFDVTLNEKLKNSDSLGLDPEDVMIKFKIGDLDYIQNAKFESAREEDDVTIFRLVASLNLPDDQMLEGIHNIELVLSDNNHVKSLSDMAGNKIASNFASTFDSAKTVSQDHFDNCKFDTYGFHIECSDITNNNGILSFNIYIPNTPNTYYDAQSIRSTFKISLKNNPLIIDEDIIKTGYLGNEIFTISVDTNRLNVLDSDDIDGVVFKIQIDKNQIKDSSEIWNGAFDSEYRFTRNLPNTNVEFYYNDVRYYYDETMHVLKDIANNPLIIFNGDSIKLKTLVDNKLKYQLKDNLGTILTSASNICDVIIDKVQSTNVFNALYEIRDNYGHSMPIWNFTIRIKDKEILIDEIISDNGGERDYEKIVEKLFYPKNMEIYDPDGTIPQTDIDLIINDDIDNVFEYILKDKIEKNPSIFYEEELVDVVKEIIDLVKKYYDFKDKIEDVANKLEQDPALVSDQELQEIEIDYELQKEIIKEIINSNESIKEIKDKAFDEITRRRDEKPDCKNEAEIDEVNGHIKVYGTDGEIQDLPTDHTADLNINVRSKISEIKELRQILDEHGYTDDNIIIAFDLGFTDSIDKNTRYDLNGDILVRVELDITYIDSIKKIVLITYDDDGKVKEIKPIQIANMEPSRSDPTKMILYFYLNEIGTIVFLDNSIDTHYIYIEPVGNGGTVDSIQSIPVKDGVDKAEIEINLKDGYIAEIYVGDKLVGKIEKSGTYILDNLSALEDNEYIRVEFVKKVVPTNEGGGTGGGSTRGSSYVITVGGFSEPNTVISKAYMQGYKDGTFGPNKYITREEVATIVARNHEQFNETYNYTSYNDFNDTLNRWSKNYIGFCKMKGLIQGYKDGSFHPKEYMTRGELAKLLNNFLRVQNADYSNVDLTKSVFNDIEGKWYKQEVNKLASLGYISGYKDGSYKGNNYVTRAEIVKIMNKINNISASDDTINNVRESLTTFKDVSPNNWFYKDVILATNSINK